ncbi:MAG: response regulator [Phycisphaerales bacterium]|nr:response regulator [Hyphomonadaceae bacterium]
MTQRQFQILVVEDEMMIALDIEDCLIALGHGVVGPVSRVLNAMRLAETETIDLAFLDINVAGEEIYPVAEVLKARGIPFVFLSGYGVRGLSENWASSPMLAKPFALEDLKARVEMFMQDAAQASI